ncbi:MAG TPA: response regulator [Pyrinomonadaceae bacterium]|nr:response regulator [Pyrinomonadaceae bacterium]
MSDAAFTILIVDDYSDTRSALSSLLRRKGYQVIEARNGNEGVWQATQSSPDLILMDLAMPSLDGIEATRQIRQSPKLSRTPIFAISAYATREVRADALAAGFTEVFSKPLDFELLLSRIRAALGDPHLDRATSKAVAEHNGQNGHDRNPFEE